MKIFEVTDVEEASGKPLITYLNDKGKKVTGRVSKRSTNSPKGYFLDTGEFVSQQRVIEVAQTDVEKGFDQHPFEVYTPRIAELADKYNVGIDEVMKHVAKGVKAEGEHTTSFEVALEIALDHIAEKLDYYDRLADVEEAAVERGSPEHIAWVEKKKDLESQIKIIITGEDRDYYHHEKVEALKDPKKKAAYDKVKAEFNQHVNSIVVKNPPRPSNDNGTAGRYLDARPGKRYMGD